MSADGAADLSVKLVGGEGFTPVEKTVAGGSVVFEGVPVGSYTVTLLKDGQPVTDQSVQVTVTACPTPPPAPEPELGVVAAPDCVPEGVDGGTVTVPVSADGAADLSVKLVGGEGFTPVEKTVAGGSVVFEGVPVGSYTVTLLKDGQPVTDQSVQVTVTACPTPPPAPEPELGVVAAPDCVAEGAV
ncbi:hypothetical protein ACFP6A_14400, partial [Quadrisphaera sp. GCM10027208]|uniref:hypothetical protein n=1 Tax=Quadrisphaera sp. GCM10027208 TaxID=3273423 RepID=UPI00361032DF